MLSMLLFALGVAIALFLLSNFLCDMYIEKQYLSDEKKAERANAYKDDLQKYVTDNALSCGDTKKIAEWAQGNKYLYILIYKDDKLLFESGQYGEDDEEMGENKENADDVPDNSVENGGENNPGAGTDGSGESGGSTDQSGESSGGSADAGGTDKGDGAENKDDNKYSSSGITIKTPTREELISEAVAGGSYPIVASDGVLLASMVDYTEYLYYDIFNIVSIVLAFVGFVLVMWISATVPEIP